MTSAKGSLDFLSNECVVGTALSVERTYLGEQLASGEGVTLDYLLSAVIDLSREHSIVTLGGRLICGGGRLSSETSRC